MVKREYTWKEVNESTFKYFQSKGLKVSWRKTQRIVGAHMKANPGTTPESMIEYIEELRSKKLHYTDSTGDVAVGNMRGRAW